MAYKFLDKAQVQFFLDNLKQGEFFTVIFMTNSDEQRLYTGKLIPSDKRSDNIAFEAHVCSGNVSLAIKSFNIGRVLSIV
jgi:hypothetical protein